MKYTYEKVLENKRLKVKKISSDTYKIVGENFLLSLPKNLVNYISNFASSELYADFDVTVLREITSLNTEMLMKGVETQLSGIESVNEYKFNLDLNSVHINFYNEEDEFESFDITDLIENFKSSHDQWDVGNKEISSFYEEIARLVEKESV